MFFFLIQRKGQLKIINDITPLDNFVIEDYNNIFVINYCYILIFETVSFNRFNGCFFQVVDFWNVFFIFVARVSNTHI